VRFLPELVRRVVEARNEAMGVGPGAIAQTAALPPVNEKGESAAKADKDGDESKDAFWKKLKCW
jgi:hypothetical protein